MSNKVKYSHDPGKKSIALRQRIQELLSYEPETGLFRWKIERLIGKGNAKLAAGSIAGCLRKGYVMIGIDGRQYSAHRLVWFLHHDEWPKCPLDHINRDRTDNRLVNLRKATWSQNIINSCLRLDNNTGHRGVWYWPQRNKWKAYIQGKTIGYFRTKDEAISAYQREADRLYGEFANFRRDEATRDP